MGHQRLCAYCLINPAGWDIRSQEYGLFCAKCQREKGKPEPVIPKRKLCLICKQRIRKQAHGGHKFDKWCLVCDREKRSQARIKKQDKKKKDESIFHEPERKCKECDKYFIFQSKNEKYCHDCKQYKTIREANERWVEDKPKPRRRRDSNAVAYSFFRLKYSVPNNVFRR